MHQLRNLIGRTNVSKDPIHRFNESDDFFKLIITCYVLVAAMKHLKMEALDDIPNIADPQSLWMRTDEERKSTLNVICTDIVDQFISFEFHKFPVESDDKVCPKHLRNSINKSVHQQCRCLSMERGY